MNLDPKSHAAGILAAIVESSGDAIFAKDLQGTILSWNEGAARLYGYSAAEIIGQPVETLIPENYLDELRDILRRIAASEPVANLETIRRTKAGVLIHVSLTVSPIKNALGAVIGASAIARDITAQQGEALNLRNSEARLRSILNSAVDGIVLIDAHGRVESFNAAAERLFGYAAAEVMGRNINMLMPAPYHEEHDQYLQRYLTTGVHKIIGIGREVTGLRKDGGTFPVHLSVGELVVDGERKFTGILHDLSTRVRMEAQLREQATLVRLGEMAAVIAHEVKNPMAAIRGAIQVIGKRLAPGSREALVIGEIIARIDALNALVKDLLLFARPPQPRPASLDISAILSATAALVGQDAEHQNIRVAVTGAVPPVMADAELLRIVFINLLLNSAHAMKGTGVITVSVSSAGGTVRVAVADTGPGIAPEIREKLFTPFVTTKSRGTGLGLSTVKRLLEAQGGIIEVECPPTGGTIMTVCLPLA